MCPPTVGDDFQPAWDSGTLKLDKELLLLQECRVMKTTTCPRCRDDLQLQLSRWRWFESPLRLFLLIPIRCQNCGKRFFCSRFSNRTI